MQGASGTFAVNGTQLTLSPSYGHWLGRDTLGIDGNNNSIYPTIREFEMGWDLIPISDLYQLINTQLASVTGTLVWDLPRWGASSYIFYSYSGTRVNEPSVGQYFVEHASDVVLVIKNIRTN